jgi:hypothetical protein
MDTELIDHVAALVADVERGVANDPAVDWSLSPPEGGLDHGYALGVWLLSACLDEPRLSPLAEALTRPQPSARPAQGERAPFLAEERWQEPFAIACGRLLERGPWDDRALQVSISLRSLEDQSVVPTVLDLLIAGAELEPAPSELVISRLEVLAPGNARIERIRRVAEAADPLPQR